jgi:hypothetical protein
VGRYASSLHPGVCGRAERDLARGRVAGRSFSARSCDEDADLLPDKHTKNAATAGAQPAAILVTRKSPAKPAFRSEDAFRLVAV